MQMGGVWMKVQSLLNYLHCLVKLLCCHINGTKLSINRNFVRICFKRLLIVCYCFVIFLLPAICKTNVDQDAIIVWINFSNLFVMFDCLIIVFAYHSNSCQVSFDLCILVSIASECL